MTLANSTLAAFDDGDDDREVELYDQEAHPVIEAPAIVTTTYTIEAERRPVIPASLRNRDERRALARNAGGRAAHVAAFHAVRSPKHGVNVVGYTLRGVYRTWRGWTGWAFDREHTAVRAEAIRTLQLAEARSQYRQRKDRVRWRGPVFWLTNAATIAGGSVGWAMGTPFERWAGVVGLGAVLAYIGRPMGKAMFAPAVVRANYTKLTEDLVERALLAAGLAKLDKEGKHEIRWVDPCARDGNGYLAVVDLPGDVTVQHAIDARASIASGLHVPAERLWLERDTRSERRLRLWVGDVAMSEMTMPVWPLLKGGTVDLFGEFPFGVNARGRIASMSLAFTNVLVGAIPRMGKTFVARLIALAAALDPTVELHNIDFKGGGDWMMFEPVAHTLIIGDQPDDIEAAVNDLRSIRREMGRRYVALRDMAKAHDPRAPEAKVTRELANDKSMGLHPIVVSIDEVQVGFGKSCEWADEMDEIITDLVKRGPAVGVIAIVATQKPDAASLPSGIRDNVGTRFGLRVLTHIASDMILGSGMSVAGFKAHAFGRADKGVGYLVGAADNVDAEVVKAYQINSIQAEVVIARAYELRNAAGTISGQAAGHAPVRSSLLHDVLAVMQGDRQHCDEIAVRLAGFNPAAYLGWDASRLAGALRGQGVDVPKSLKVGRINKTGVRRDAIDGVLDARTIDSY